MFFRDGIFPARPVTPNVTGAPFVLGDTAVDRRALFNGTDTPEERANENPAPADTSSTITITAGGNTSPVAGG